MEEQEESQESLLQSIMLLEHTSVTMTEKKIVKTSINSLASVLGGLLRRLGGSDHFPKSVRRYGVAGILSALVLDRTKNYTVMLITFGASVAAFSLGYGENSVLAGFFTGAGVQNQVVLDICVRGTVGLAYGTAGYLPTILFLKQWNYLYIIGVLAMLVPAVRLLGNVVGVVAEESLIGFFIVSLYCFLGCVEKRLQNTDTV